MDKPINLSVKEWIIRNMSTKTMVPERIIEAVINHQFDSAQVALKTCYSLEFSGFGKFYYNKKRVMYKLKRYNAAKENYLKLLASDDITPQKRHSTEVRLESVMKEIEILKLKMPDEN